MPIISIYTNYLLGPGGFVYATRGGVCNAKLAIVITIVQSSFFLHLLLLSCHGVILLELAEQFSD